MNSSVDFYRKIYPFSVFFILGALFLVWHLTPRAETAVTGKKSDAAANETDYYDIRTDQSAEARAALKKFISDAGQTEAARAAARKEIRQAESKLRAGAANLKIEDSEDLQRPEIIAPDSARGGDFLTAPTNEKRLAVFRRFLKENSALIGLDDSQIDRLETTADYTNPDGNLSFVRLEQKIGDVPVFRGEVRAGFTKRGEIIRVINNLAPRLAEENVSNDFGSAEEAVSRAAEHIGLETGEADTKRIAAASNNLKITFERGRFADLTTAEKMYFPVEAGVARAAWRVLLWQKTKAFYVIVDAADGTLLWRKNITSYQTRPAAYGVYANATSMLKTADSPTSYIPGCATLNCPEPPVTARQTMALVGNEPPYAFNNLGWIPDTGLPVRVPADDNVTDGNAVEAGIDRDGTNGVDGPVSGSPNRVFNFTYNPAPGNPPPGEDPLTPEYQKGSVTQAFYLVNRWHDEMYLLGFTEQARNFQHFNFGRGGIENDRISAEIQDSSGFNNANMSLTADGARPRMQMYIWTGNLPPNRDSALDSHIVVHELTHGLAGRLHGNGTGLGGAMASGMNEGWADFYALAMLAEPSDNPLLAYPIGSYASSVSTSSVFYYYGARRFPTAVKSYVGENGFPHNPLTLAHLNQGNCSTFQSAFPPRYNVPGSCGSPAFISEVWQNALWEIRARYLQRLGAAEGNRRILQFVTDGMKLAPLNPSFFQERDAMLAAAQASGTAADVQDIWAGFATRGLGFSARIISANPLSVAEAFDTPNVVIGPGFAVSDAPGNNNGYPDPGEPILLTVPLLNNTGAAISDVAVQVAGGGSASYGAIAAGQTVSRQLSFTVPANATCGDEYALTFTIGSSAGTRAETRGIIVGTPFGGAPVTIANSTPLTIPSSGASTPYGTTVNAAGLTGSKRIRLELTGLTHTFPGDLDVLLVGPGGQKFVVMSDALGNVAQNNANVVLRDTAAELIPPTGIIGLNGEWKPANHLSNDSDAFQSPAPAPPYQNPAPTGNSTFTSTFGLNSANLNGIWTLYVVDDTGSDNGALQGWKLTFEPADYLCCFCPSAQKTVVSTPGETSAIPTCTCIPPPARADFDGDGRSDISVFRPSEGNWYLNQSNSGFAVLNWGLSGDRLAPGDFDGDLKTDFAVFRPNADSSQPDFYVLRSSNFTYTGVSWGLPGDAPVVEDYDGDGRRDIAVFRPSNHTFYVLKSVDGGILTYSDITSGAAAAGDFDGDGKGDFATYSENGWYLSRSNGSYATVGFTYWGTAGDVPVPADYDGDGKDDFAVFRPSDRTWYILKSGGGMDFVQFGLTGDVPVPGDFDGDRKADIAVYRAGLWYINRSSAGMAIAQFGLSGDVPIANRYLP